MSHDESYTYINFILLGLENIVTDYHLPNNHILYSIFAHFSTSIFGNAPWALRLPALFAGVLLIPASYLAGRQYFNSLAGLFLSGIVATFPVFLNYASSARGYAQIALFSTLLWFFATLLLKKKNLFIWFLFILTAAAGFYTIPIMLYPYTAIMAWLFFAWIFDEYSAEYTKRKFFIYLFFSGIIVVLLFLLLYFPVFIKTGISYVFYSDTIKENQDTSYKLFLTSLRSRTINSWEEWHKNTAPLASIISSLGLIIALIVDFIKKRRNYFFISLLIILIITSLQRAVGWARIWFFFAPVYFGFATAGFVYLLKLFKLKEKIIRGIILTTVIISLGYSLTWLKSDTPQMSYLRGKPDSMEVAAQYLSENITPKDALVSSISDFPSMQYYIFYYGIPLSHSRPSNNIFTSVYAILTSSDETVEETLHSGTRDRVSLGDAKLVYSQDELRIYKIPIVIFYEE